MVLRICIGNVFDELNCQNVAFHYNCSRTLRSHSINSFFLVKANKVLNQTPRCFTHKSKYSVCALHAVCKYFLLLII